MSIAKEVTATGQHETLPPRIQDMFGEPPVLNTEKREIYESVLFEIVKQIRPQTVFEWFWAKDLTDLIWIIRRYRWQITLILDSASKPALKALLKSTQLNQPCYESAIGPSENEILADKFYGSPKEKSEAYDRLAKYNLDVESIAAEAFVIREGQVRTLEGLIQRAGVRRDRILREIAFYRETLADLLDPLTRKMIEGNPSNAPLIPQQDAA